MNIRHVAFAAALLIGSPASADALTNGTATRVGEGAAQVDEIDGRSQIKLVGKATANPDDLTECSFTLEHSPIEILFPGAIFDELSPRGKASEVTFQTPGSGRPSLKAIFKKRSGELEFTIAIDRAATVAPDGINTQPCQSGDEAVLVTSFTLQCGDATIAYEEANTWRVPANCNADFPNLRVIR